MGNFIDLTGQKFGRLTVVERVDNANDGHARWLCECVCGKRVIIPGYCLTNHNTKSCGCLHREITRQINYSHGHSGDDKSKTYATWRSMNRRCNNKNQKCYKNYGGRGIKVCEKWKKFEGFLQDMGEKPNGMTLDRVDNNGDYCKENCRWITNKEQQRNTRRSILVTINNIAKPLPEWCEIYQKPYKTVWARVYKYNWTPEEALGITIRKKKTWKNR